MSAGVYANPGARNTVPQIVGFPYDKDPNKAPLASETPPYHD